MHSLLLIGIGGFIGAVLRYLMSGWVQNGLETFPLGTLAVNVMGSFVLSLVMNISEYRGLLTDETRIFLTIGVLGAFTTMSTFSYESIRLLEQKEILLQANLGNKYRLGKKHTEETKDKISKAHKGHKMWVGKKHTLEARKKMNESNIGQIT